MAAPVTKPARRPSALAQAAVDLGAVPVDDGIPDYPEEETMETTFDPGTLEQQFPGVVTFHGVFDQFPITYTIRVADTPLITDIKMAETTSYLREIGVTPPVQQVSSQPPASPQNSAGNRDVWNDGSKAAAGNPGNDWQTCGHGSANVEADQKFGGFRCKFRSSDFFPGSRHWSSQDGTKQAFFCKVNSRGGGQ